MKIKGEINVKCLEQCLAQSELSVNVHYYYNLPTWEANCSLAQSPRACTRHCRVQRQLPASETEYKRVAMIYGLEGRLQ